MFLKDPVLSSHSVPTQTNGKNGFIRDFAHLADLIDKNCTLDTINRYHITAHFILGGKTKMNIILRPGSSEDATVCGEICFKAFKAIAEHYNFPPNLPTPDIALELLSKQFSHPNYYSVVAEIDGRIVGSNFLDERSSIVAIGPVSVDPTQQNRSIGRQLMQHLIDRIAMKGFPGARLVTEAYHNRSFTVKMLSV
jgi:predicted N-acetyltransferase YhbS